MILLGSFTFTDPWKREWPVPAGAIIDGASIPQPLWSLIGGPYEGKYRDASIVHDYYCELRTRESADVHKVFLYGMNTRGAPRMLAKIMYYGVARFGPRWSIEIVEAKGQAEVEPQLREVGLPELDSVPTLRAGKYVVIVEPEFDQSEFDKINELIKVQDFSISAIERLATQNLDTAIQDARIRVVLRRQE